MSALVTESSAVSTEWLTEVLHESGALPTERRVVAVDVSELDGGYIAHTVRLRLDYDRPVSTAPASLIAKFPANDELSRGLAQLGGLYTREVLFYQEFAATIRMRTPRCHLAELSGSGGFALVLEDVADAVVHDQDLPCPMDDALLVANELALLHAAHWNDPALADLPWLNHFSDERMRNWEDLLRVSWLEFTGWEVTRLEPELRDLGDRLCGNGLAGWAAGHRGPSCLTHADFHLTNLLFRTDAADQRHLVTVDWQMAAHAAPLIDVAYFLGRLAPRERQAVERRLVRAYHTALCAAGVTDYPWSDCWADYQRCTWYGLVSSMVALAGLAPELRNAGYAEKVVRFLWQIHDHDAGRFLPA
ncbi:ecdysteroid 22-kinase family protein [Goodfellowiella coeruleoviolacea]|uniref:Ecdysteroid kinase n=1 Tax=Goodfellowiella coeruleoviolacea TaxID=334858 RepID=A0AAE3GJ48_9PSEU|nr:ecdysteroid 22-kinase family protein [Goodfellowiella coeruleoviolacea]MCP2168450.1 Ecdysteroid kinase [Goodfellowiella coeruleoviolacea]